MREICTSGSVGASESNLRGDPTTYPRGCGPCGQPAPPLDNQHSRFAPATSHCEPLDQKSLILRDSKWLVLSIQGTFSTACYERCTCRRPRLNGSLGSRHQKSTTRLQYDNQLFWYRRLLTELQSGGCYHAQSGKYRLNSNSEILTTSMVADYLHCHLSTVYRLVKMGAIPHFKLGVT
jgi:excisionase family DNA binding protein